ncbi:unnamed protein product, partial [Mesorhabditis spiculigera]
MWLIMSCTRSEGREAHDVAWMFLYGAWRVICAQKVHTLAGCGGLFLHCWLSILMSTIDAEMRDNKGWHD